MADSKLGSLRGGAWREQWLFAACGRGEIDVGRRLRHSSIVDSTFDAWVTATAEVAGTPAVITDVEGSAFRTGEHRFELDPRDGIGTGFLLR